MAESIREVKIKIEIEIDTNKGSYKEEFDNTDEEESVYDVLDKAKKWYDTYTEGLY